MIKAEYPQSPTAKLKHTQVKRILDLFERRIIQFKIKQQRQSNKLLVEKRSNIVFSLIPISKN
jgi:hypothetical protein